MKTKSISIQNQILLFAGFLAMTAVFVFNAPEAGGVALAFALTTGFTKTCSPSSGGAVRAWGVDAADVTSFTLNGGTGAYSAVTMVSGKVFKKFEFEQDSAFMKWDAAGINSISVTKMIEFYLKFITQTHRNRLQDILDSSACGMIWILEDSNAQKWVFGYTEKYLTERPMQLKTSATDSGKVFTDPNGSVVTLERLDSELPRTFTGTVPV